MFKDFSHLTIVIPGKLYYQKFRPKMDLQKWCYLHNFFLFEFNLTFFQFSREQLDHSFWRDVFEPIVFARLYSRQGEFARVAAGGVGAVHERVDGRNVPFWQVAIFDRVFALTQRADRVGAEQRLAGQNVRRQTQTPPTNIKIGRLQRMCLYSVRIQTLESGGC